MPYLFDCFSNHYFKTALCMYWSWQIAHYRYIYYRIYHKGWIICIQNVYIATRSYINVKKSITLCFYQSFNEWLIDGIESKGLCVFFFFSFRFISWGFLFHHQFSIKDWKKFYCSFISHHAIYTFTSAAIIQCIEIILIYILAWN